MKISTKKVLLLLYLQGLQQRAFVSYPALQIIFPDLTPGGLRSLMQLGRERSWWRSLHTPRGVRFELTERGLETTRQLYRTLELSEWQGRWEVWIRLSSGAAALDGWYLQQLIRSVDGLQISSQAWIVPADSPESFRATLHTEFPGQMLMTVLSRDQARILQPRISAEFHLGELATIYSSVSRQTMRLLALNRSKKGSINQSNEEIRSMFDRLQEILLLSLYVALPYIGEENSLESTLFSFSTVLALHFEAQQQEL